MLHVILQKKHIISYQSFSNVPFTEEQAFSTGFLAPADEQNRLEVLEEIIVVT